jgi:hypothetical protein
MLALLRPHPHRGDTVAAGVVVLTLFTVLVNARFASDWSELARLLFTLAFAVPVIVMAVQAVSGDATPRPYESILHVASFLHFVLSLGLRADVLGAVGGSGSTTWVGALVVLYALWFARERNSAIMTLLAALAAVITFLALVDWVLEINSASDVEWLLLGCAVVLTLGAVSQRDRRRRHAVSLADAAGITVFALGLVVLVAGVIGTVLSVLGGGFGDVTGDTAIGTGFGVSGGGGTGWEIVLLAYGFGLIAYGCVDRERVPQFIGIGVLLMFLVQALWPGEDGPSLVGWPIVLLVMALGLLVIGLRPRQDLPPEPEVPHP